MLYAVTSDDQRSCGIVSHLPDTLFIVRLSHLYQVMVQALPRALQGQYTAADGLQMGMVGSRGTTMRTII